MTKRKSAQLSFAGGIFSEPLFARADLAKYSVGLAKCDNFIIRPQGSVENRSGFEFIDEIVSDYVAGEPVRLVPFVFSNDQAYTLVFIRNEVHFFLEGARLLDSAGNPFVLTGLPFPNNDVIETFDYAQSADTLIIVHGSFAPFYIYRTGDAANPFDWSVFTFAPSVAPPTNLSATATTGGSAERTYLVTALSPDGIEESLPSASVTVSTNWTNPNNTDEVRLQWQAPADVQQCRVYKLQNGTAGLIGIADSRFASSYPWVAAPNNFAFVDDLDLAADTFQSPPIDPNLFSSAGEYPRSVCFYNQRLVFGGTDNSPQTLYFSQVGAPANFTFHVPPQPNDSITATIAATRQSEIRYLVPTNDLMVMTDSTHWKVGAYGDNALEPETINIRPQGQDGTARVKPLITGNSVIFIDRTKGRLMSMEFDLGQNVYKAKDISIIAYHLMKNSKIKNLAELPDDTNTLWMLREDGALIVCTYVPDQQIVAFSTASTKGKFIDIVHIPDDDGERIYALVEREINGSTRLYIERTSLRKDDFETGVFLDGYLQLSSPTPVSTVTGLDHLEGETVNIVADGSVLGKTKVTGGAVELQYPASRVSVGLPYRAELKTLPIYLSNVPGFGIGDLKNVSRVFIKTYKSKHVYAYAGAGSPLGYTDPLNPSQVLGTPIELKDEVLSVAVPSTFTDTAQISVFQENPLPTTILAIAVEYSGSR